MAKRRSSTVNAFDTQAEVADLIFGESATTSFDSGSQEARLVPLDAIWADVTQPRHVIPSRVRGSWAGEPSRIPELLLGWGREVEKLLPRGTQFDWLGYLRVENYFDFDVEGLPAIGRSFIDLLDLAKNIYESGLNNPITVCPIGTGYVVITGERRLTAYRLLNMAVVGEFDRIYVIEREQDKWTQIAENSQRSPMNAISNTRAFLALIMEMYEERQFEPYTEMVTNNGCDRAYYAQAADLQIKRGFGERVMNTLNIRSRGYLTNYRNLLKLSDAAWMAADEMSTPERRLRDILKLDEDAQARAIYEEWDLKKITDMFTMVNISPQNPANEGSGEADLPEERVFTRVGAAPPKSRFGEGERPAESLPPIPDMEPASPAESLPPMPASPTEPSSLAEPLEEVPDWAAEEESRAPVSVDTGAAWVLDMLHPLAKEIDAKGGRVAHAIRNRSPEDIRLALVENGGDAQGYQAKLQAEGERIDAVIASISGKVWGLLEQQRLVSLRIAAEMMSDDD